MAIDIRKLRQQMFDNYGGQNSPSQNDPYSRGNPSPSLQSEEFPIRAGPMPEGQRSSFPPGALRYIGDNAPDEMPVEEQEQSIADMIKGMYTPETQATNRYNKLLDEMPTRGEPSIARKIASSAAGFSRGAEAGEKTLYEPYNRSMADWSAKVEPYSKAADLERYSNVNERQLAAQTATSTLADRRAKETERANRAREANNDRRTELMNLKQMNPDLKWDVRGARIRTFNPKTGQTQDLGPTENLSEVDKLIFETMVKAAYEEAITQPNAMERITKQAEASRDTKAAPGEISESDVAAGRNNRLVQAYLTKPQWKKFIKGTPGNLSLNPPSEGTFFGVGRSSDADFVEYAKFTDFLSGTPSTTDTNKDVPPPNSTQTGRGRGGGPGPVGTQPVTPKSKRIIQHSQSTGKYRYSDDGEKTWKMSDTFPGNK